MTTGVSLLTGIAAGRWAELADLYADDVVVEIPFGIPEPRRLVGREQLRAKPTGREFRVSNAQLLRVRDGLIVASRDYHNHWAMAAAKR